MKYRYATMSESGTQYPRMLAWVGVVCLFMLAHAAAADAGGVRLFILSGQSNMKHVHPEEAFTPAVVSAFPDDEVVVVHDAQSGQLIRLWYRDWQPPEGDANDRTWSPGKLYDRLMAKVDAAMEGKPEPVSITFVWMQGEADGNHAGYGELYGDALQGLLAQLQEDLGREDIDMVLGRISDFGNNVPDERPSWMKVRETQVAFAEADPQHRAWVDTDDLNGKHDGLHYNKAGYQVLGERFAEASIRLLQPSDQSE